MWLICNLIKRNVFLSMVWLTQVAAQKSYDFNLDSGTNSLQSLILICALCVVNTLPTSYEEGSCDVLISSYYLKFLISM